MKIIKEFRATSPMGSDCTTAYDVILNRSCTVGELLSELDRYKEWGIITIDRHSYTYKKSHINCIPPEILELQVEDVKAVSGWSRTDYKVSTRPTDEILQFNVSLDEQKRLIAETLPSLESVFVLGQRSPGHPDHDNFCFCSFSKSELVDALLDFMLLSQDTAHPVITAVMRYIKVMDKKSNHD